MTIKNAHAKTCQWLLERSEYVDWLNPTKLGKKVYNITKIKIKINFYTLIEFNRFKLEVLPFYLGIGCVSARRDRR